MAISPDTSIVLISGANQGIGLAAAQRLAREAKYHVIVGSRNSEAGKAVAASLESEGFSASSVQLDISSDTSIAAAVEYVTTTYGRLDVLVNNAGILIDFDQAGKLSTRELFQKTYSTNVFGTACLTEAFLPLLRKAQLPRLIFVSSTLGSVNMAVNRVPEFFWFKAYDSSKAALNMMSLYYRQQLKDTNALVNVVCPGLVQTKLSSFNETNGHSPETGAQRILELATAEEGSVSGTFSDKDGVVPW